MAREAYSDQSYLAVSQTLLFFHIPLFEAKYSPFRPSTACFLAYALSSSLATYAVMPGRLLDASFSAETKDFWLAFY